MRPILSCVLGLTPAVITESLWAPARRPDDPFVPEEIHVLTTANGRRSAEEDLLSPDGARRNHPLKAHS